MKLWKPAAAIAIIAGLAWTLLPREQPKVQSAKTTAAPLPYERITDPTLVFQKAFWKRPGEQDRILQAERREWRENGEITHWQWFIELEPSPAIVSYLKEQNAFGLARTKTANIPKGAPKWFSNKTEGTQILQAPGGTMQLIFLPENQKLYATGSGKGFTKGTPELAANNPRSPQPASRIPTTSPKVGQASSLSRPAGILPAEN
jgi:hypothetical protein